MRAGGRNITLSGRYIRTARIDGELFRFIEDPKPIVAELRHSETRIDFFTFLQRLPETSPQYSYPMEWDNLAVVKIDSFDQWWNEQLGFKARNKAKQAEKKGAILREVPFDDALAKGIWEIYNETPIRQGRKFPHYGKTFERVCREAATFLDCSIFLGAFFEDKLIGFAKLTIDETGTQAGLMHIISMVQHREKAPTNALIAQAVRACAQRGIRYLSYAHFAYGNKTHDSLSDFKERSGFKRINLPRYYIPLTLRGRVALSLGLHLSLHHHLPESLIIRLRRYRADWYNRKFNSSKISASGSKALGEV
jgi:hypothetical protein